MIQIDKTSNIPKKLLIEGQNETIAICNEYNKNPNAYKSKKGLSNKKVKKFSFDNTIYGDKTVKQQLRNEQYNKCCYCESKFDATSHGDVEHFRPKMAYNITKKERLRYPGYYWLAYEWNNLFYSCEICNRSNKKNLFPLLNEKTRIHNHHSKTKLKNEKIVLIHPSNENPEDYIFFEKEIAKAKDNNTRGKRTIEIADLNRKGLNNDRLEYLKQLEFLLSFT